MKDKKNIDRLFKEGFKNFEASPSPEVWENIQAELNKEKRNRKPIPLWIKYGGVAALLAVFFTVGNLFFNPGEPDPNIITNIDIVVPIEDKIERENNLNQIEPHLATEQENYNDQSFEEETVSNENAIKSQNNQKSIVKSSKPLRSDNAQIASERNETQNEIVVEQNQLNNNNNSGIAVSKTASELPKDKVEKSDVHQDTELILEHRKEISKTTNERFDVTETATKTGENPSTAEIIEDTTNKKSILDAIAENVEINEDIITEENQKPGHRWDITPNVAPVYYNSFGSGSSIDADFSDNPQKGEVNMSYGLQVSYALNDRLSVRSGVNNVDLSYSTSNIVIGTAPVAMGLRSVDYGSRDVVVTVFNRNALTDGFPPPGGFGNVTLKSTDGDARLIQSINYYEVPLELKYSIVNTRLGVNIIGGVSTLFLGNNEISVTSDNFSSVLGEANNLSDVSFSTNIGLGLDYKLSRRFVFNIEPMFKYQLNPYTDSSVNFKPYYLGVYSGLSFKF